MQRGGGSEGLPTPKLLVASFGAGMALHHALCQRRWVHLFKCFAGSPGTYDIPLGHVVSVGSRVKTSGFGAQLGARLYEAKVYKTTSAPE